MATTNIIGLYPRIGETKNFTPLPIDIFLDRIKNGYWQDQALHVRTASSSEEKDKRKKQTPYVTIAGTFESRKDADLIEHSGYIAIDLDDIDPYEPRSYLQTDPFVYAIFTSVSGAGLCVLFKIDGKKHREAHAGIAEYLFNTYRLVCDPTSVNLSRARFVSFDPDLYINEKAQKFNQYVKYKAPTKLPDTVFAKDDFTDLISRIESQHLNLCESYSEWVRIGFAFAEHFGEDGRGYFHAVSAQSGKYVEKDTDKQYTNCLKARGSRIATIATFYYYCKQAGLSLYSQKTKTIISAGINAKKGGRDVRSTVNLLQNFEEISPEVSAPILEQVFSSPIQEAPEETLIGQLETYLRHEYNFRRNEITRYIEDNGKTLKQADFNSIFINAKKLYDKTSYELIERLINSNFTPTYNPIKNWFIDHQHINTEGNIDKLFKSIITDNDEFAAKMGKKWIVSVVASAHGIHSPIMLVLAGKKQNTGKTEFFRRLLPAQLQAYYGESKLDAGKDDEILMTQKLIIMDDEMGGKNKKDEKKVKDLLSKQMFSLREPYGKNNVDLQRVAVLCGTTNDENILNDPTGNRRFLPIHVLGMDHKLYNEVDKTQLLMEAYHLWKSGFQFTMDKDDIAYLNENTERFESYSMEYELISKFFQPATGGYEIQYMTATDLKVHMETYTGQKMLSPVRIGKEMIRLGFSISTQRINQMPVKCYAIRKIS